MADTKPISVEFSLTVNLGNFNSAKLGATITDQINSTDEFDAQFDILYGKLRRKIYKELSKLSTTST